MPEQLNGHQRPDVRPVVVDWPAEVADALPVDLTKPTVVLEGDDPDAVAAAAEPPAPIPVDQADAAPGGWMAERRARLVDAPPVLPAWLRSRTQLAAGAAFVARWYGRQSVHHAVRVPLYTLRLWSGAPRGAARLTGCWWRWVSDADAKSVTSKAAAGDVDQWVRYATMQTNRTDGRRKVSAVVGIPVALALYLVAFLLPPWVLAVAAAGILSALGYVGRDSDRPIVHRYVAVQLQRRLESAEVDEAMAAIGVKGKLDYVSPIAVDGPGWLAEIDLPRGTLADSILDKRENLAGAMRRPLGCVWPETDPDAHPGRVRLWVAREDPSRAPRRLWPLLKEGQTDLFAPIPFGWDPRGRPVSLELTGANMLIGGVMGSGKTSAVLVLALAGALDPTCELWLYEMKGSGDLDAVRPVAHHYRSGDDDEDCAVALGGLAALEGEMKRRKKIVKELPLADVPDGRKVSRRLADRKELGLHPILAIFDEAHTLFEHETYGDEAAAIAGRLIRKARAYGIVIVFTTQRPDANSIPKAISDNAILRFCLAVTGHLPNNLVLGSGAYARGVRATMFDPRKDAGTGWLARSALDAQIARAAFIKQDEAEAIARRAMALRIAAGTLSGQAAGEDEPEFDQSTIVDHLRDVWPAGDDAVLSWTLVQALAAYRPDVYSEWIPERFDALDEAGKKDARTAASTMLATALKPHGVATRQLNRRGKGGGGKGVRWDDLAPS